MRFAIEVKRRGVLKVATAYLIVSWLALEIGHTLFNIFDLPHLGLQLIFVLLVVGFPLALLGAWQGWFGAMLMQTDTYPAVGPAADPHAAAHRTDSLHGGAALAVVFAAVALFAIAIAIGVRFFGMSRHTPERAEPVATRVPASVAAPAAPAASVQPTFAPPAHSIAVLPFVNMSGDSQQDYFSDGLSEELLNSLARITQLQVAARTSSFSFKGGHADIADIAHKLNVGAILEGSVRKAGPRVRITAQLINAVTGFQLWSQSYDRELKDILTLQTEIANAVTSALQATLLPESASLIELGGTQNPLAFDAYLRGQTLTGGSRDKAGTDKRIAEYAEAIRLDPRYAKAYVGEAAALRDYAGAIATGSAVRPKFVAARAAAEKAIALAPDLGEAHTALAQVLDLGFADYTAAKTEYERALALSPGDAFVLRGAALFFAYLGHTDAGVSHAQRAVILDPLNPLAHRTLANALVYARRYSESIDAYNRALEIGAHTSDLMAFRGWAYAASGDFEAARESCSQPPLDWLNNTCLAIAYHKLNRQADSAATLAAIQSAYGDSAAIQYAQIYAQWGDNSKALQWLETAYRVHDPGLVDIKVQPMLDPLRKEARFQEIERKLRFPD